MIETRVRVRFAPSPTGYLHIGNARTALFNYLFARQTGGRFVLRIEDTDAERSRREYEKALIEDLRWLGMDWDEGPDTGGPCGPYRQTERLDIYRRYAEDLLREGKAYLCFCSREELEQRSRAALESGSSGVGYDNRCRQLTSQEVETFRRQGRKPVVRFRVPERTIQVDDLIRGTVTFAGTEIPDFVILKSDGMPTFHFSVVVDDILMGITHVIRGEDHLPNTPKHVLLFECLSQGLPRFAHMSMTMGPDRTRLSKRHGATSVRAYRENGFLPEAVFNYLALLGWGSAESQEVFSREELVREFSLDRCTRAAAVFDPSKLLWMNGLYIRGTPVPRLADLSLPFLNKTGVLPAPATPDQRAYLERVLPLLRDRLKTLKDVPGMCDFFFREPEYDPAAVSKFLGPEGRAVLAELNPVLQNMGSYGKESLEAGVRKFCEDKGYTAGQVFHPLRVAVSGRTRGPGLFEMLEVLGKARVAQRLGKWQCQTGDGT